MSSKANISDELTETNSNIQGLSPALQSSIKKIIEKENFPQHEVTVTDLNTMGNSFLGKPYEVIIKCFTPGFEKEINIFVKEKFKLKSVTMMSVKEIYANEELVYKDLSKVITKLQDQANVPPEERFKIAKGYDETSNDVIILENLRRRGFKIYGKAEPVSLKFVELGVKELAKLHALSFVIENKMPEYFKEKFAVLEGTFIFNDDWKELIRDTCSYVANLYEDDTKIKIENFVPVLLEKLPKYQKDKTNICTLSHGDYKKNNIMVRFVDGEPVEVVPIDYQFIDYGCSIRDLLFFIFTTTDQEFRRKHLNDIKDLYFETLSIFLKYFDMDVETVYPKEEFEKLYTEWLDYGLMMTLTFAAVIFGPDAAFDFENNSIAKCSIDPNKKYDHLLRGLVDDFVEWGYL